MRNTKRKPVTVGEMLKLEFLEPLAISNSDLASAIGVHRNTISNLINGKTALTSDLANKLAAALGNTPEFWLNIQHAVDVWNSKNTFEVAKKAITPLVKIESSMLAGGYALA
ncbi:HigA family addiction module antitoxin [Vibrio parahaemolyticus]|uniref:HigA family addiction module antitoxin n=1 Tax=Vibrio parahaemolyticus TaxID=670 RepID=UPI003D81B592